MPKRSNTFQTLIFQIQQHFLHEPDYSVNESKELTNILTGERREVDIVVETKIGDVPFVICFECTAQGRKVGSPWVESMLGKHKNLGTHRLILVSETGFSEPALRLIEGEKIAEAVTLQDAEETNWNQYVKSIKNLVFGSFEFKPEEIRAHFEVVPADESDEMPELSIDENTRFIRVFDKLELDYKSLALDILSNKDLGTPVMDRWFKQPKEVRQNKFVFSVNWAPLPGSWAVRNATKQRALLSVDLTASVTVKETPLLFSHKLFMATTVSYATVEKVFTYDDPSRGNKAVVAITGRQNETPKISVAFPDAKPGSKKSFVSQLNITDLDQSESDAGISSQPT